MLFGSLKPVIAGWRSAWSRALALTRLLVGLVYGVSTTDPRDLHFAAAAAGVVAFLAGLFPALRASRIDPLEAYGWTDPSISDFRSQIADLFKIRIAINLQSEI